MTSQPSSLSKFIEGFAHHSNTLDTLMKLSASDAIFLAFLLLIAMYVMSKPLRTFVATVIGIIVALGVAKVIGHVWDRPRPFVAYHFTPLVAHAADASFPSDHLCVMGAITVGCLIASRKLGLLSFLLALLIAFARVFVGVHYASDVAGGFVIGAACTLVLWWICGKFSTQLETLETLLAKLHLHPLTPHATGTTSPATATS